MKLAIEKSPIFESDVTGQFGWYLEKGGEALWLGDFLPP